MVDINPPKWMPDYDGKTGKLIELQFLEEQLPFHRRRGNTHIKISVTDKDGNEMHPDDYHIYVEACTYDATRSEVSPKEEWVEEFPPWP